MSIQAQVVVRSKKLGVLIRDARLAQRKTIPECATATGVPAGFLRAWEEGRKSPSLPELEVLAYYFSLPMSHFWSKDARSDNSIPTGAMNLPALVGIRQRLVGAMLRQEREKASLSLRALSESSGISIPRLKSYELGERPIPLPELEGLMSLLGGRVESLFDQNGPVGLWMAEQRAIADFLQMPREMQDFASKPVNRPYLELAMKLSNMSTDKLRSVAEDLLDITL
ncbi:MAG: helix-turn-helix domain-containing protein [Chloroflexi bacterium]|nr:helix-turn-helix domain-containing protein [Chloroflexota bacterium]